MAVFCNVCLSLNKAGLAHGWPFWPLELIGYEAINECAINVIRLSSHGWPYGLYVHHLYGQAYRLNASQLYDKPVILVLVSCSLIPSSIFLDDYRNIDGLYLSWWGFIFLDAIHVALNAP